MTKSKADLKTNTFRLILGDQLNPTHSWFKQVNQQTLYVLMEIRQETDYVLHHAQKIIAIFAGMRALAERLRANGHRVHYLTIDDPQNLQSIPANLSFQGALYECKELEYQAPDEWRLDQQMREFARGSGLSCHMVSSEHFYTEQDEAAALFSGKKSWLMEHFYRAMRKKHKVLWMRQTNRWVESGISITTIVKRGQACRLNPLISDRNMITLPCGTAFRQQE